MPLPTKYTRAPTVIVYGPAACGKTRNAAQIARHFGIPENQIIDEWHTGHTRRAMASICPYHLHLTIDYPRTRRDWSTRLGVKIVAFADIPLADAQVQP